PQVRDILELSWSRAEEARFRRFIGTLRFLRIAAARAHLPLQLRYAPYAVQAFKREGIDPSKITVESARAALAEHRARREEAAPVSG
ncbi:DUF2236 domain-containing protein, partial [Mycolicibacter minnesotensis]